MKKQIVKVVKDSDSSSGSGLAIELPQNFFEDLGWDTEKDQIEWVVEDGQVKIVNRSKGKERKVNDDVNNFILSNR